MKNQNNLELIEKEFKNWIITTKRNLNISENDIMIVVLNHKFKI
jgi:hypothetical protein